MNLFKLVAETILAAATLYHPELALAQPMLSQVLDKAPYSQVLKKILKKLKNMGVDMRNLKQALVDNKYELEMDIKTYLYEVLDQLNKPTKKILVKNAGISNIIGDTLTAEVIEIDTKGKTNIKSSRIEANEEIVITTEFGGKTDITDSVIGKNGGMKSVIPQCWHVEQPSGWYQKYDDQGNYSIGTIGKASDSFFIKTKDNPKDSFNIDKGGIVKDGNK